MKKSINFVLAIIFTASLLSGSVGLSYGVNFIPSPREQMDNGTSPANVVCKEGLELIIRVNTNSAACIMSDSYDRILQLGWAKTLEDYKSTLQPSSFGDVKTVRIVPLYFDTGIRESKPEIITTYNYVFEACAKSEAINTPEILIISDSETKLVNLSQSLSPMSCKIGTTQVKAADTNSIKVSLAKKTDLANIANKLESNMIKIQDELAIEKKELADLVDRDFHSQDDYKKISEKTDNIVILKKELEVVHADWQKNQYVLILGDKEPIPIKSKVSNKVILPTQLPPMDYAHVNKIKITPQYVDSGRLKSDPITSSYKFDFEACAVKDNILSPEVLVRSDSEAKSIKFEESLNAFSCQIGSTVIRAADKNNIQGTVVATGEISKLLTELDSNVFMIQESIAKDKKALLEITNQRPTPDDFEQKVSEITNRILNLKNELNQAKEEFKIIKYMVYE